MLGHVCECGHVKFDHVQSHVEGETSYHKCKVEGCKCVDYVFSHFSKRTRRKSKYTYKPWKIHFMSHLKSDGTPFDT